ncbi:hypothetical protein [Elizabethkingia anophelis]|uniref:Uncharacterized protein n=2 Tax=Elizabethkingia anophelis TaxID=1117645 RepID=A0A455ZHI2_9FLAO|nr:hypothetical protein [Elizabethkingia anophelis]ATC35594.1 hypothetical protein BAZ09_004920 [Elizabethkingia anophelis R26]ATC39232.1 hypothetical protein EAAG1_004920 [Elizabethkingia anophelis Ag1]ATC42913.1 hypothetical protein CMV41_04920 [Elizabethkingia anophelis]ATC46589.1 hypothetical protein CMV40_04920 [Elizabethkingia anophelis]ELR81195.1 hypothetical protein D505_00555 [Elizabethkingia anophelis R26]
MYDIEDLFPKVVLLIIAAIASAGFIAVMKNLSKIDKKYYEITFSDKNVIRDSMIETSDYFQSGNTTYYKTNIISAREITNIQKK